MDEEEERPDVRVLALLALEVGQVVRARVELEGRRQQQRECDGGDRRQEDHAHVEDLVRHGAQAARRHEVHEAQHEDVE